MPSCRVALHHWAVVVMVFVTLACIGAGSTLTHEMNHSDEDSSSSTDSSGSTDRFTVNSESVESIDSSNAHLSAKKVWSVASSKDEEIDGIKLELPGLAFVSYIDDSNGPLAHMNVSGDSADLVGKVSVQSSGDKTLWVGISNDHDGLSGYLLAEVFLTRSSKVKDVVSVYSGAVVVEDNVLASTSESSAVTIAVSEQSSVFLSAADAALSLTAMHVKVLNSASLQVDMASVAISEEANFRAYTSGSITLFAASVSAKYLTLEAHDNGQICFDSDSIDADHVEGGDSSKIAFPNSATSYSAAAGSFSCVRKSVPTRAPSSVTNGSASGSADSASSTSTTISPEVSSSAQPSGPYASLYMLPLVLVGILA